MLNSSNFNNLDENRKGNDFLVLDSDIRNLPDMFITTWVYNLLFLTVHFIKYKHSIYCVDFIGIQMFPMKT